MQEGTTGLVYANMPERIATAVAHPNIALIMYWGDIGTELYNEDDLIDNNVGDGLL